MWNSLSSRKIKTITFKKTDRLVWAYEVKKNTPTLYVALLIYNAIIIIWKNCRKTMTSAGLHASFSLMKCFAAVKKLVDFLPDTVSVNSSFLNQDISFISDPLCFGARMAQRPDY